MITSERIDKNERTEIIIASSNFEKTKLIKQLVKENLEELAVFKDWVIGYSAPNRNMGSSYYSSIDWGKFVILIGSYEDFYLSPKEQAIRDTILHDLGLFRGYKDLDNVFLIIPESIDLHLPLNVLEGNVYKYDFNSNQQDITTLCEQLKMRIRKILEGIKSEFGKSLLPKGMEDEETTYDLFILNELGDSFVRKNISFFVKEGEHISRDHDFFADSPQTFKEMSPQAFERVSESEKRSLIIRKIWENEYKKRFQVRFGKVITEGERFSYEVWCKWNAMFPKDESFFKTLFTANKLGFNLFLPDFWKLKYIKTEIIHFDDNLISNEFKSDDLVRLDQKGPFRGYQVPFIFKEPGMREIKVTWEWK